MTLMGFLLIIYACCLLAYMFVSAIDKDDYKEFYGVDLLFLPGYLLLFILVPVGRFIKKLLSKRIC